MWITISCVLLPLLKICPKLQAFEMDQRPTSLWLFSPAPSKEHFPHKEALKAPPYACTKRLNKKKHKTNI